MGQQENAINEIDDRVILLNTTKAEQTDMLTSVQRVTYNKNTGVFVFTWHNGETLTVDLNIEKIPTSFSMDENGIITMSNTDGTKYTCDVKSLIKSYLFNDSNQIKFTITTNDAGNYEISASIIAGSITKAMLEPNLMGEIEGYKTNAAASATTATQMAVSAENNAKTAKSYAVGGTGSREDEDTDNAKYYASKAREFADKLEVVPIANGGTGATTAKGAECNINGGVAEITSDVGDDSQIIMKYTTPDASKGVFFYRKASYFWNYIKSKISSVLGLTATNYKGTSAKATADASGNNIEETYAKDLVSVMTKEVGEWKEGTTIQTYLDLSSFVYGNGIYVAGGTTMGTARVRWSEDGLAWNTPITELTSNGIFSVVFAFGRFFARGATSIIVSDDGKNWSALSLGDTSGTINLFYTGENLFYIGASGAAKVTKDGYNWTACTINNPANLSFESGKVKRSENGIVVATSSSKSAIVSYDGGFNWTESYVISGLSGYVNDLEYGRGIFIVTTDKGDIAYSKDGKTWSKCYSSDDSTTCYMNVAYGDGIFIARVAGGTGNATKAILYSKDGIVWKNMVSPITLYGYYTDFCNGKFFMGQSCTSASSQFPAVASCSVEIVKKEMPVEDAINETYLDITSGFSVTDSSGTDNVMRKIPSTTVYIPTTGWVSDTEYSGYGYLFEQSISDCYDEYPEYFLKPATGIVPTSAEKTAFNNIAAMKLDSVNKKLKFYAATKPTTNLLVVVKGVQ